MNKLYLTAAVLSVLMAPQAMAQTMMSASGEVKSEVPEYDVLDKSQLQSKVGLKAGLSTGNEIEEDNMQRYGNDLVNNAPEPLQNEGNLMQGQSQMQAQTTGQMQANVPMQQQPMQMQQQSMSAQQDMMVQTPAQPAAPQVTMQQPMAVQQPAQPMITSVDAGTQVNVETYAVGNTDTGVNMDQVQRLLANQ